MQLPSLRLLSCSWPRPVLHDRQRWTSDPEWEAPLTPGFPACDTWTLDGHGTLAVDWRAFFSATVATHGRHRSGEMKGFHVVFRLRVERSGTLVFHDDDGSIIRIDGEIVHEDREAHALERHELRVRVGDVLDVAQWQYHGDWAWAGRIEPTAPSLDDDVALFEPHRADIARALREPNGPLLKTYFAATHPLRAALAVHSLILNGYRPAGVKIYGDYQWSHEQRNVVARLLPFAEIVPTAQLMTALGRVHASLAPLARSAWAAMKICVGLFDPPDEYCMLDDDVVVLGSCDDAVALFRDHDLVYQADCDHGESYRRIWGHSDGPLETGNLNTGVCFVRNRHDHRAQGRRLVSNPPADRPLWLWEQGFMATEFSNARTAALPTQRYFYPIFDGLPGGLLGYDWIANPCGFATVHFGGLSRKPTDDDARTLARSILGRRFSHGRASHAHGTRGLAPREGGPAASRSGGARGKPSGRRAGREARSVRLQGGRR